MAYAPDGLVAVFADEQAAVFRGDDSEQDTPQIGRENVRTWRRQILHRDFARHARRIACPIAHCSFARE